LTISDPACGTGGFLVAAYEWLIEHTQGGALDRDTALRVKKHTYFGQDLVARPRRLALMNLYLHGIEPHIGSGEAGIRVGGRVVGADSGRTGGRALTPALCQGEREKREPEGSTDRYVLIPNHFRCTFAA
jgi:N-6 DNA Methylase